MMADAIVGGLPSVLGQPFLEWAWNKILIHPEENIYKIRKQNYAFLPQFSRAAVVERPNWAWAGLHEEIQLDIQPKLSEWEAKELMEQMGEKLVTKYLKIRWWNNVFKVQCPPELEVLNKEIIRFFQLDLEAQRTRNGWRRISEMVTSIKKKLDSLNIGAQIWKKVQTLCPGLKPKATPSPSAPTYTPQPVAETVSLLTNSQWQKGKLIGSGSFGRVYVATDRNSRALCAIKEVEIFPDEEKSAKSIKQLWQEIKLLRNLEHPNIVQCYDSEIVNGWFRIYLEYVPEGSIKKYIEDNGAIPESDVRRFTTHILSGLNYLHSENIVHRDIKGANLLIDSSGVVRLADFGVAKHLALHSNATKLYVIGTAHWTAPELVCGLEPSKPDAVLAVDIWSVGCTVLEMLTGRLPWGNLEPQQVLWKLFQRKTPPIPEILSSKVKDFLQCCFQIDPVDRPSAAQLLEHPFLKN